MQLPPVEVLYEIVPAGVVSGLVLLVTFPWRRQGWPGALAIGGGFATTFVLALGWPELVPVDATRYLFHFAVGGAVLGVVLGLDKLPAWARHALPLVASAAVIWVLLRTFAPQKWPDATDRALWLGGLGVALYVIWTTVDWRAKAVPGVTAPLLLFVAAAAGGHAIGQWGGSGQLGQLMGALAAALGPAVAFALLDKERKLGGGAVAVTVILSSTLLICAVLWAELPRWSALLLAAAPLAIVKRPRWLSLGVAAALLGAALFLAYDGQPEEAPDEEDPYADYR